MILKLLTRMLFFLLLFTPVVSFGGVVTPFDVNTDFGTIWDNIEDNGPATGSAFDPNILCENQGYAIDDAIDSNGNTDAYDHVFLVSVNEVFLSGGDNEMLDSTTVGNTFNSGSIIIDDLDINYQLFFPNDIQCVRFLLTLTNPTSSTIDAFIQVANNFGSDSRTVVEETSSGDTVFDTSDLWVVTSDDDPPNNPISDPVNTTVTRGEGMPQTPPAFVTLNVCDGNGTQGVGAEYDIQILAGETRSIMLFGCLSHFDDESDSDSDSDVQDAIDSAREVFGPDNAPTLVTALVDDDNLLDGLDSDDLAMICNWDFDGNEELECLGGGSALTPAPTLSEWGFILFAVSSGLIAVWFMRKRFRMHDS